MKIGSPHELLIDQIRDLYSVETQVSRTMPELAARATEPALQDFLDAQGAASLRHIGRLQRAAAALGSTAEGDVCKAMEGLIEGGDKHIDMAVGPLVTDLILTAHTNRIIHYKIAGYDVSAALAKELGVPGTDSLLVETLEEETAAAKGLAEAAAKAFTAAGWSGTEADALAQDFTAS